MISPVLKIVYLIPQGSQQFTRMPKLRRAFSVQGRSG